MSCDHEGSLDEESEAIKIISECQRLILSQAKLDMEEFGCKEFIAKKMGSCFQVVKAYSQAFQLLQVSTKKEFDKKVSCRFRNAAVRDSYEDMLNNEEELKNAGFKVLVVSFGQRNGALKWIEETGCAFDMVLDEDRKVYQAFGLNRSVSKVWNIGSMVYYAEQVAASRQLPRPFQDVVDDPIQMGGDFVLDTKGVVVMSYPSQSASDRPSVDQLLLAVQGHHA